MANVIGPDVSFYQDDPETPQGIDFVKMKASAEFVIIRAGQNLWVDPDFKLNWREAKLAGLPRGSYWFYDSRIEPKRQAELWVAQFEGDFGELPLFADLEESYKGPYAGWKNWYTFLERLKQLVNGKEIFIYTAYYYWRDNAPNATTQASNLEYFHQYPLWIANYGATEPLVPAPWSKDEWLFWQYTETGDGNLFGVESKGIDLNYFNGDLAALRTRFNLSDTPPSPPPAPEPNPDDNPTGIKYTVTASPSLRVREGPGTSYNSIGLLYPNEIVEEINANADRTWLKVRKLDDSLIGWSAAAYLQKTDSTPPPPAEIKKYKVTTPSLIVYEGPGTNYTKLGSVTKNEIVEEIGANTDRSWLKIKNSTGRLIGWSQSAYLDLVSSGTPTTPPAPDSGGDGSTGDGTIRMYKVTASPSLVVREGPGLNYNKLGSVTKNEIVEEIGANADRTWLKIKNSTGRLIGWSSAAYLLLISETPSTPPDSGGGDSSGDGTIRKYKVTASPSLLVREGPGLNYNKLGSVTKNEIVEEIGANADRSWLKIKNSAGNLVGWSFAAYLELVSETPTTPPSGDGKEYYRVIRSSLQLFEQANTSSNAVGTLYYAEVVEKVSASADGIWMNVRKSDGSLIGWCKSEDLITASSDLPPLPEEPPTTVPSDSDRKWYRVGYSSLTVRDSANVTGKVLGTVVLDDTLPALDDTSTPGWIFIRRVDGLTGWVESKYMVFLSNTRPASVRQNLFKGITYLQKDLTSPRKNRMHVIAIDLLTTGLQFLVTPTKIAGGILCTRTVSKFLEEFGMGVAINGDGFSYMDASVDPVTTCPGGGDPVKPNSFAASRGTIYYPIKTVQPTVYIGANNQVSFTQPGTVFNAISGDRIVVQNGATVKNLAAQTPNPRTAIGLNKSGRWLVLMVIDGRQPGYSEGVTFPELADLLLSYGAYTGVNMDGGGSSTMVIKGVDGKARLLNSPIDSNVPGKERSVANHLGVYIK